jgi:hypothetical protein
MRNPVIVMILVGAFGLFVACGSSPQDVPDVTDAAVGDVPGEDAAVDVPGTDEVGTTDTGPEEFEWDPSPTPNCVDDFCAAGPGSAPNPMEFGPFPVGLRRVVFVDPKQTNYDGTPRTLVTEIWYPTTKEYYDDNPKFAYDIREDVALLPGYEDLLETLNTVDVGTFPVQAVKDAPVRHGDGRYPLVLFSHGAFGIRFQSIFYTVLLASHGYVVVAPDHDKNTLYDLFKSGYSSKHLVESAFARPKDIQFLMSRMEDWDRDPGNEFYKTIDTNNVGITGHSFGGYVCFAATYFADENGYAELDPRVKVIVPQAPAGYLIGVLGIYGPDWHLPTMIQGGEMDNTLDFKQAFKDPWDTLGAPKWFLNIKRGGHYTFSDLCTLNLLEAAEKLGYGDAKDALTDGCGEENWSWHEAKDAINLYSVSAFNRYLRLSADSAQYMTPEAGARFGAEVEFLAVEEDPI